MCVDDDLLKIRSSSCQSEIPLHTPTPTPTQALAHTAPARQHSRCHGWCCQGAVDSWATACSKDSTSERLPALLMLTSSTIFFPGTVPRTGPGCKMEACNCTPGPRQILISLLPAAKLCCAALPSPCMASHAAASRSISTNERPSFASLCSGASSNARVSSFCAGAYRSKAPG